MEEESGFSKLLDGFERSDMTFALVGGPPRIDKISPVHHVLQNHQMAKAFVLYGNCSDQPGQVPYHVLSEAINDWISHILVLSEEELNGLREKCQCDVAKQCWTRHGGL